MDNMDDLKHLKELNEIGNQFKKDNPNATIGDLIESIFLMANPENIAPNKLATPGVDPTYVPPVIPNRLDELDRVYNICTKWMNDNPKADFETWKFVSDTRMAALKEQTQIFRQQLKDITQRNENTN